MSVLVCVNKAGKLVNITFAHQQYQYNLNSYSLLRTPIWF